MLEAAWFCLLPVYVIPTKDYQLRNPQLLTLYKPKQRKAIVGKGDQTCKLHQISSFSPPILTQTFLYALLQSWFMFNTVKTHCRISFKFEKMWINSQKSRLSFQYRITEPRSWSGQRTPQWAHQPELPAQAGSPGAVSCRDAHDKQETHPRTHNVEIVLVAPACPWATSPQQPKVSLKLHVGGLHSKSVVNYLWKEQLEIFLSFLNQSKLYL